MRATPGVSDVPLETPMCAAHGGLSQSCHPAEPTAGNSVRKAALSGVDFYSFTTPLLISADSPLMIPREEPGPMTVEYRWECDKCFGCISRRWPRLRV